MITGTLLLSIASLASANFIALPDIDDGHWQTLDVHSNDVLWIGSSHGDVARSTDGGHSWDLSRPAGHVNKLPVYQIDALDERRAFVLTSGRGDQSRLLRTRNGGFSWSQLHRGDGDEHLRCFSLIEDGEGWILGDTVNGEWHIVRSARGRNWLRSRTGFDSPALPGERAFNKSGSCVRFANNTWLMGTAHAETARIMHKSRSGLRFTVTETPISAGAGAGITSVWPADPQTFLIAGGDFSQADSTPELFVYENGDFTQLPEAPLEGAITTLVKHHQTIIVANHSGIASTPDRGESWELLYNEPIQILSCSDQDLCYGLGDGTLVSFSSN